MKVRELIAKLQHLDGDMEVICFTEDEVLPSGGNAVVPFDVLEVSQGEGEMGESSPRAFRFGRHAYSQSFALVKITADH